MQQVDETLLAELKMFLPKARENVFSLATYYRRVFGVELNTRCSICISDGITNLQKYVSTHAANNNKKDTGTP